MPRLEWDKTTEKTYETGVSDVALYVQDNDGNYGEGIAWNGCTGVTESPDGAEPTDLYADNIKYLTMRSKENLNATVTAYMYPNAFKVCDGTAEVIPGVNIGQQARRSFGLAYKTLVGNDVQGTDFGFKLHLLYGCTASPSEKAYSTVNDSPEANEFSWEIKTTELTVGKINDVEYKPTASMVIDSTNFKTPEQKKKLDALMDYVYGAEGAEAKAQLPLPAKVIEILTSEG